jgi:hypothetical protein
MALAAVITAVSAPLNTRRLQSAMISFPSVRASLYLARRLPVSRARPSSAVLRCKPTTFRGFHTARIMVKLLECLESRLLLMQLLAFVHYVRKTA